jgi:ABC-type antimicrobial peptide transport system permease subunit
MDFEIKDFREVMQGALSQMKESLLAIMIIGIVAIMASGIGIHRALGATRADIVWQFVPEAMMLGVLGGAGGTGFLFSLYPAEGLALRSRRGAALRVARSGPGARSGS